MFESDKSFAQLSVDALKSYNITHVYGAGLLYYDVFWVGWEETGLKCIRVLLPFWLVCYFFLWSSLWRGAFVKCGRYIVRYIHNDVEMHKLITKSHYSSHLLL